VWTGDWKGQKYCGGWRDNQYHGHGTLHYKGGTSWTGNWINNNKGKEGGKKLTK